MTVVALNINFRVPTLNRFELWLHCEGVEELLNGKNLYYVSI